VFSQAGVEQVHLWHDQNPLGGYCVPCCAGIGTWLYDNTRWNEGRRDYFYATIWRRRNMFPG